MIDPINVYHTFSDESCQSGHAFGAIGGILCKPRTAQFVRDSVAECMLPYPDAMKWERIRPANLSRYKRLVNIGMDLIEDQSIDFAALVYKCADLNHKKFNDGDSDLGFNKFIAQHLFRHAREMGRQARIHSYYAAYSTKHSPTVIQDVCNEWCFRRHRYGGQAYFGEVKHRPFKSDLAFSLSDIILGAVAKSWNNGIRANSPKMEIAELIRKRAYLGSLAKPTPRDKKNFDVWEFRLERSGPRG